MRRVHAWSLPHPRAAIARLGRGGRTVRPVRPEHFAAVPEVVTFTVDLEEHPARPGDPGPVEAMTRRILDLLDRNGAKGTFFVVGELAERMPGLVRELAVRGHELGLHGWRHVPLTRCDPRTLRDELARSRFRLEELTGTPVTGFRAPIFSLTAATAWAAEAIAAAGFTYSSSVLPARGLAFGFPGAPTSPFVWPCGLLEIPCPVGRIGPLRLPCLGGMYLRYLPPWRLRQLAGSLSTDIVWTYCHPYDFDTEEPFGRAPGKSLASSFFLWWRRAPLVHRLSVLLQGRRAIPFRDRLQELASGAAPLRAAGFESSLAFGSPTR